MEEALFSRSVLEALPSAARVERLQQLSVELSERLEGIRDGAEFFTATRELVGELQRLGHDLRSFDSDGETFEAWAGDYARPEGASKLILTFTVDKAARAEWSPDGA
jgi:hypothetical protein